MPKLPSERKHHFYLSDIPKKLKLIRHLVYTASAIILIACGCTSHIYLAKTTSRNYRIEKVSYAHDTSIANILTPYKSKIEATMNQVVGNCDEELKKARPNSSLGNFVADAMQDAAVQTGFPSDFAIQNYGGIRIPYLAKGPVTVGLMYELMPFDNTLVVVDLSGKEVQQLLDHIANDNGWPVSKNVNFKLYFGKAADVTINQAALNPEGKYKVAMPDYVASGGDNLNFLKQANGYNTQILIRDILIDHVKTLTKLGKSITPENTMRIQ